MKHSEHESSQLDILSYRVRERFIRSFLQTVPAARDVNPAVLARVTSGLSEEELGWLCNKAVQIARYERRNEVTGADFEVAIAALLRRGAQLLLLDPDESYWKASRAAAQALVAWHAPTLGPVQEVTLLSDASPVRLSPPSKAGEIRALDALLARLDMLLAERVAAEILPESGGPYEESGPDLTMELAEQIVAHPAWNAGDGSGWGRRKEALFSGILNRLRPSVQKEKVEALARELVAERRQAVLELLTTGRRPLEQLVELLLEEEAVDRDTLANVLEKDAVRDGRRPI